MDNKNALDELNKGVTMALSSINFIYSSSSDEKFKKELENEYKEYEDIEKKAGKLYEKYKTKNDSKINETTMKQKMISWYGIKFKTLLDKSTSKLSDLMLQGTNMGIIEGRKILNNKKLDNDVKNLLSEFVIMQEKNVETLKKYL